MKVLVTLDGTQFSEAALELAKRIIESTNAEVHMMRVGDPVPDLPNEPILTAKDAILDSGAMARPIYEDVAATLPVENYSAVEDRLATQTENETLRYLETKSAVFGDRPVKYYVALGDDPADYIIDYAKENGIDLIVMATHGRSGLAALIQGSVAGEVVRSGVAPVTLVRPSTIVEAPPLT